MPPGEHLRRTRYLPDMIENGRASHADTAEAIRRAVVDAAGAAYEDAGLSGLCAEGRWEAAVDAMRSLDLSPVGAGEAGLTADLSRVIDAVGTASSPPPSGGSVAASAGALAAALTQMTAGLTAGRPRYADVAAEMQDAARRASALAAEMLMLVARDAAAVDAVGAAYRVPKATEDDAVARAATIERAMLAATEAPLESVCRASALTVGVNVGALRDTQAGLRLEREAGAAAAAAGRAVARALVAVDHASGRRARSSR
jgi:formiminotetrahydrofolate cyclodeaminase